ALTCATMSSTEWASRQIGNASMFAKRLNRAALPSMTGIAASGPRSPRPRMAEPSETTATVLRLIVSRRASSGFSAMALTPRATPGVDHREVVAVADRQLRLHGELAAEVGEEGAVGDLAQLDPVDRAQLVHDLDRVVVAGGEHGDVRPHALGAGGGDVERGDRGAAILDACGDVADRGGAGGELESDRDGVAHGRHR